MIESHCTICGRPLSGNRRESPDFPFCSSRCRLIDLSRWLGERYRIPGQPDAEDDVSSNTENDLS